MAPTLRERAVAAAGAVIAVASGKGGVGKTWFAITLAHAFARRGEAAKLTTMRRSVPGRRASVVLTKA